MNMFIFDADESRAMVLSTLAGLTTTLGGFIAVYKKPDARALAFLLGIAIGVMSSLSFIELYAKNVMEYGFLPVTASALAGAGLYACVAPCLPNPEHSAGQTGVASPNEQTTISATSKSADSKEAPAVGGLSRGRLLRLGILMAFAMTLHNLPEGFAVACASFTKVGPTMAFAIGMHNVPEGIIIAAPVYAATGSRPRAIALATASGLSEPVGALLALKFMKPYLTPERLDYLLAGTGGIMTSVCGLELWSEAKKCGNNDNMYRGIIFGGALMILTLHLGA